MSGQPGFGGFPGGFDPSALGQMFGQLQRIFSGPDSDGPVNWSLAREVALETLGGAAGGGGAVATKGPRIGFGSASPGGTAPLPGVPGADAQAVREASHVADLWLDAATTFPASTTACEAWTPHQWVDRTLPTWKTLAGPVAERMAGAMGTGLGGAGGALPEGLPPEAAGLLAQAGPMLHRLGGGLLGMQLGQAIGAMAREVTGAFDVGYPLAGGTPALLPAAVAAVASDTGLDQGEVRLFLALRELAHARLFAAAPWLAPTLLSGIERYASGIQLNVAQIQETLSGLDPTDPSKLQEALTSGVLEPPTTPEQQAALARLEHLLALVEGWVETVTGDAARAHVPHPDALVEHQRRRRAVGGPAERTFSSLVGLELRPRRMREAAAWWQARGTVEERDAFWAHPDLLPSDLDEQAGDDDLDDELRKLLDGE